MSKKKTMMGFTIPTRAPRQEREPAPKHINLMRVYGQIGESLPDLAEENGVFVNEKYTTVPGWMEPIEEGHIRVTIKKQLLEKVQDALAEESGVKFFSLKCWETDAPGYGRVFAALNGKPIAPLFCRNIRKVIEDESVQPNFGGSFKPLYGVVAIEARIAKNGRFASIECTRYQLVKESKTDFDQELTEETLPRMVFETATAEMLQSATDPSEVANIIGQHIEENYDAESVASWQHWIAAMATAMAKANGMCAHYLPDLSATDEKDEEVAA